MSTISIAISTRNRSNLLKECLESLHKQSTKPLEIIIVDNASTDDTQDVCASFNKKLPIKYYSEKKIGTPFARNRCIQAARGVILAFLDDDCVANCCWLENIQKHFLTYRSSVGVMGISLNNNPQNISGEIEQVFYERWLSENISNLTQPSVVLSGSVIDTKNCTLRSSFIKKFTFSATAPHGDVGNDEDVEIGNLLFKANRNIYFDPTIQIYHNNSQSISRLLYRNFWEGFANRLLLQRGVNVRKVPIKRPRLFWFLLTSRSANKYKTAAKKLLFLLLLFTYPIVYIIGRFYADMLIKLSLPHVIPKRI